MRSIKGRTSSKANRLLIFGLLASVDCGFAAATKLQEKDNVMPRSCPSLFFMSIHHVNVVSQKSNIVYVIKRTPKKPSGTASYLSATLLSGMPHWLMYSPANWIVSHKSFRINQKRETSHFTNLFFDLGKSKISETQALKGKYGGDYEDVGHNELMKPSMRLPAKRESLLAHGQCDISFHIVN